ncbi:MAG: tRNA dihydrouridine synthase DusB [Syntrophales bacterium]|nr:tRNA dihydrouridine synthase DusB [Syntrophales bacterium]
MKIGKLSVRNKVFLAPLAGITNLNYRLLAREFGCSLAFTEMVSANGLIRSAAKTFCYLDSSPADRPLGVQIFGSDPAMMAEAASIAGDKGADLIDINMGCPVKKVIKTGAGAALLRDPGKVKSIVSAVRKATDLPLTIKIRAGWQRGEICAPEIARIAEEEGADAVIVHPRTADQGFSGLSDWSIISRVKEELNIPVIGNGDIHTAADALRMMSETGCDAVMVGRGSLGNPWIFKDILLIMLDGCTGNGPTLKDRAAMICRHLDMEITYIGPGPGLRNFRKHLLWYTKGLKGGAALRLALSQMQEREAVLTAVDDYFRSANDPQIRP